MDGGTGEEDEEHDECIEKKKKITKEEIKKKMIECYSKERESLLEN